MFFLFITAFTNSIFSQQVPILAYPPNGGNTYVVNPLLSWYNTTGENLTYHIQVSLESDFATTILNLDNLTYINLQLSPLDSGKTYYWHVRSKLGTTYSPFTATWSFLTPRKSNYVITASAGPNGSIYPEGAINVNQWATKSFTITAEEDYNVADVIVDGVSVGSIASYTFYTVNADHIIEAKFNKSNYTITASSGPNGSITPEGDVTVSYNGSQTFDFTPDTGYEINDVLVDGVSVGNAASYTFSNVDNDHTIFVSYNLIGYTITATAASGGSISPSGDVDVVSGEDQTFDISPEDGYKISDVLVDGVSQGAISSYTFTDVVADHMIDAQFIATTRYYVSVSGNDGNSGTETSPFATVAYALTVATAGDEIMLLNDSFNEGVTINKGITLLGSGSSTIPYLVIESNDVVVKSLTISFNSAILPPTNALLIAYTRNNIIIEDVTVIDNYMLYASSGLVYFSGCLFNGVGNLNISGLDVTSSCFGLSITSSNGITLTNVVSSDNLMAGMMIYNCTDFTFSNVSATGNGNPSAIGSGLPIDYIGAGFIFDQVSNGSLNNLNASDNFGDGLLICLSDELSFTGGDFNNNYYGIHLSSINSLIFFLSLVGSPLPPDGTFQNISNLSFTGNVDIIQNSYCGIMLESSATMIYGISTPVMAKISSPVFKGDFNLVDNGLVTNPSLEPCQMFIAGAIENPEFNGLHFKSTLPSFVNSILINGIDLSSLGGGFNNLQPSGIKINNSSFINDAMDMILAGSIKYIYEFWYGAINFPALGATEDINAQNNDFMNAASFAEIGNYIADQIDISGLGLVDYSGSNFGIYKTIILESKLNVYKGASYYLNVNIDCKETPYYYLKGVYTYDPTKLEYLGYISNGLINDAGWFLDVNNDATLGTVTFSGYGLTPIYSDGSLFKLGFKVIDSNDGSASITGLDADFMGNSISGEFSAIDGIITYTDAPGPIQDKGDVTLDAVVTMDDFFALLYHLAGVTSLTDPQALINADFNEDGIVDMDDLNELYDFINGTSTASPVAGNGIVNIADTQYDGTASIELPIKIENAIAVKSIEVTLDYNKDLIDYKSFVVEKQNSDFVYAFETKPGQAKFIFSSNTVTNGNLYLGSIALKFVNDIIPVGSSISTSYRINNNDDKTGPTISFSENGTTAVEEKNEKEIPAEFELSQNYPNPFNPSTTISFGLPVNSHTTLKVYDLLGREVVTLFEGELNEGRHSIIWNGENNYGMKVGSGTYIYRIVAGEKIFTRKMMLLK